MIGTYFDLIALALGVLMLALGYRAGLWSGTAKLLSVVLGFFTAIILYEPVGNFVGSQYPGNELLVFAASFILILIATQSLFDVLVRYLFRRYSKYLTENNITRVLGLIPAAIETLALGMLLVLASMLLPLPTPISTGISESHAARLTTQAVPAVRSAIDQATGGRFSKALSRLMVKSGSTEEGRSLPFRPSSTEVDEEAEARMLVFLNEERAKVGAPPLAIDPALTRSARLHSEDMWDRQYFAHVNPDGDDPFDRMERAEAEFLVAGENLALAPTVQLAHTGLMNSPGHKRNILDPRFHRVGIGIIDGGIYGKMVTQNFAN